MDLDLVIRGGTGVTAEKTFHADVGIRGEKIVELKAGLSGEKTIGAAGKLVLPGGVDSHCHIEQLSSMGVMTADDFYSATVSAAHGGTTTVIPFCAQHRGDVLAEVLADYHSRARAKEGIEAIRQARARGLKVFGETCPQYLFLTAKDIDIGLQGALFCCSPPPRDEKAQEACWRGLKDGTLHVYSSDHAPYGMEGKLPKGEKTTFKEMANGVPGLELRLPLLFTYGKNRITLEEFVNLTSTRHAQTYGLYPWKGTIAVGSDADIAIWDPERKVTVETTHDRTGYTPYKGLVLTGWPVTVLSRGEVIVADGKLAAERGRGQFLERAPSPALKPLGRDVPEIAQLKAWNTPLQL